MSYGQGVSRGFQVTMVEGHREQNTTTREKNDLSTVPNILPKENIS